MALLTPPPVVVRIHEAPDPLTDGAEMRFTLWFGPLAVRWRARIEALAPNGFLDWQVDGPFARWEHRHSFRAVDAETTEIGDRIDAEPRRHPLWGPFGWLLLRSLPLFFLYRRWRTRRLLEAGR
jgi:ligand-binding SRPBCC domain-containing protein